MLFAVFRQRPKTKLCNIEQLSSKHFYNFFFPKNTSLMPCNIIVVVVQLIKVAQNNNSNNNSNIYNR